MHGLACCSCRVQTFNPRFFARGCNRGGQKRAAARLLANHIHFISHNARHNSDLIGRKSTRKSSLLRVKVINLPLSLGPVPDARHFVVARYMRDEVTT